MTTSLTGLGIAPFYAWVTESAPVKRLSQARLRLAEAPLAV